MTIDNNVYVNSSSKSNPIGCGDRTYIQTVEGGQLIIGNHCGFSNTAFTCATEIRLDDDVMLGAGCKIFDTDFHALDYRERMKGSKPGTIKTAPIHIEKGVFVGANTIILKGVTIGAYSVIGAGSVVTKNVPTKEMWAGNPARFVKQI